MVSRLSAPLRETAREWLERNPTNAPARPIELFPGSNPSADRENIRHRARCTRLIEIGALVPEQRSRQAEIVPERKRLYMLSGWTLADLLAGGGGPPWTI